MTAGVSVALKFKLNDRELQPQLYLPSHDRFQNIYFTTINKYVQLHWYIEKKVTRLRRRLEDAKFYSPQIVLNTEDANTGFRSNIKNTREWLSG